MEEPSLAAWIRLSLVPGLGGQAQRRLLSEFGLPSHVFAADRAALARCVGDELASRIAANEAAADVAAAIRWAEAPGHTILTLADPEYPRRLLELPDPPTLLYMHGRTELLARDALAIVGIRNATPQGRLDDRERARARRRRRGASRRARGRRLDSGGARLGNRRSLSAAQRRSAARDRGARRALVRVRTRYAARRRQLSAPESPDQRARPGRAGRRGGTRQRLAHHGAARRGPGPRRLCDPRLDPLAAREGLSCAAQGGREARRERPGRARRAACHSFDANFAAIATGRRARTARPPRSRPV